MTTLATPLDTLKRPDFWRLASASLGLVVVANLLIWAVAGLFIGDGVQIVEPGAETASALGAGPILVASIAPTILGLVFVGVASAIGRMRLAVGLIALFTLASLALPFALDVGLGSRLALATMHFVVGGAVVAVSLRL